MDRVSEFNDEFGLGMSPAHRTLDLVSETGELSKEVLKASEYGESAFEPTPELESEFGDVYYALLSLADEAGIDPDAALDRALEKYRERFDERGDVGSGE